MSTDAQPLYELTDAWVFPVGAEEVWWPVGPIEHKLANGNLLLGTLVFAVGGQGLDQTSVGWRHLTATATAPPTPSLRVVDADTLVRVIEARELEIRPETAQPAGTPWMRAWALAQVIVNGEGVRISYQGKKDPAPRERRLDALIPTKDGQGVFAHDLEKEGPRQFRLDRITEVITAFVSYRDLNEAVAAIPDPPPNPQCYRPHECAGLSSCPRSPSCSS